LIDKIIGIAVIILSLYIWFFILVPYAYSKERIYITIDDDKANVMSCHCGWSAGFPCETKITEIGIGYNHTYDGCINNGELIWDIPDKVPYMSGFDNCTEAE